MIAFLEGNSKIGLQQVVDQVQYYHYQPSVLSFTRKDGGDRPRNVQFLEVQKLRDLDLGLGQGHINIYSTCKTTSMPNHVTVASRTTEIWPFEFREILTLDEV